MTNIKFDYQYRDARGSKNCYSVVFTNPDNLSVGSVHERLEKAMWETEFFIADQVRIPEVFLYLNGSFETELDHCFHHFDYVDTTESQPTDLYHRSITEFLLEVELQSSLGWSIFDPEERFIA